MGRKRDTQAQDRNHTSIALILAAIGGGGVLFFVDSTLDALLADGEQRTRRFTDWQIHMGSTCLGVVAFFIALFCLELMGRHSKTTAWRSSWPWLSLIPLTALATFIRISAYAVIPMASFICIWAYRQTRKVI